MKKIIFAVPPPVAELRMVDNEAGNDVQNDTKHVFLAIKDGVRCGQLLE